MGGKNSRQMVKQGADSQHSLMDDWIAASLADDEVSPLDDDDRCEERRVTGVLKDLALCVRLQPTNKGTAVHRVDRPMPTEIYYYNGDRISVVLLSWRTIKETI